MMGTTDVITSLPIMGRQVNHIVLLSLELAVLLARRRRLDASDAIVRNARSEQKIRRSKPAKLLVNLNHVVTLSLDPVVLSALR